MVFDRAAPLGFAVQTTADSYPFVSTLSATSSMGDESAAGGPGPRASERKLEDELNLLRMDELKRMFFEADEDGNGELDLEEFVSTIGSVLAGPHATREKLIVLFRRMDANMDNMVSGTSSATLCCSRACPRTTRSRRSTRT